MVQSADDILLLMKSHNREISNYGAKSFELFGSFVNGKVKHTSDIDLLVEFHEGKKTYDNFINLAYYLESIMGRKVELVTPQSLSNRLRPLIKKTSKHVPFGI